VKTFDRDNGFMRTALRSLEASSSVRGLWRHPEALKGYHSAVSLHGHTTHSCESLAFVPRVLSHVTVARAALNWLEEWHRRETGRPIPFERAFWTPPLNPRAAFELEAGQIRNLNGLDPMISLTDHDTLEACAELRSIGVAVPYSMEWTFRFHQTVFHIGAHNLPFYAARELEAAMLSAAAARDLKRCAESMAAVHAIPGAMLVLNHPFSCEGMLERSRHISLLMQFLEEFGPWIHALELNGLQPAASNADTLRLAGERGLPVVSGGDRHCTEPNANLNLTNAATFAEFVDEIRVDKRSAVLFLPQYRDAIPVRYIEFIWQAVRNYESFVGRTRWVDRVFVKRESGEVVSCAALWPNGGPAVIRGFISLAGLLASPGMRAMLNASFGRTPSLEPERP
jgi:hypothetical protein